MEESLGISLDDSLADNDTETLTAAEAMTRLEQAWLNEKLSPDLLEQKVELVDCMLEQLNEMDANLKKLKKDDLRISIHRLEMERIQYIISNYLKVRLQKLEKHSAQILEIEKNLQLGGQPSQISAEEMEFLKTYVATTTRHLQNIALKNMPVNMQPFDPVNAVPKANSNSYAFLKVKKPNQSILLKDSAMERDEIIDLEVESQHLLPYNSIAHLLKDSAVSLI